MYTIKLTDEFSGWLGGLKDRMTRIRLARRLERASAGNFGDHAPVGSDVAEFREHFGTGWRMYYVQRGKTLIVMLGGGDKSTQEKDIAKAIAMATTLED